MLADELRVMRHECRFRRTDRRDIWVSISISRAPAAAGGLEHKVIHVENISERKKREAELSHQALHDPLTGLRTAHCSPSGSAISCATAAATRDRATCSISTSTASRR